MKMLPFLRLNTYNIILNLIAFLLVFEKMLSSYSCSKQAAPSRIVKQRNFDDQSVSLVHIFYIFSKYSFEEVVHSGGHGGGVVHDTSGEEGVIIDLLYTNRFKKLVTVRRWIAFHGRATAL